MLGLWVYAVCMYHKGERGWVCEGINSIFSDKGAADAKVEWLREELKKYPENAKTGRTAAWQRVFFFKNKIKADVVKDCCYICAKELEEGVPLSEPQKSSLDKP